MKLRRGASLLCRPALILLVTAFTLGACAAQRGSAPVTERGTPLRQPDAEYRVVIGGDTLYSIAWESGRDYRELATWNAISPPYTIRAGQKIRLRPPANAPAKMAAPATHTVQRGETLFSIATRYDVALADVATWNDLAAPYAIKPGQMLRLTANETTVVKIDPQREDKPPSRKPETPVVTAKAKPTPPPAPVTKTAPAAVGTWTWPTDGNLLTRFNSGGAKGVDIGGKSGQPVMAAAPGTVVYQGSGLRGYGQLIIVKHNTDFLSAYAHCDKIVVREGNVIKRGQKIAEMGSTGTDRVKLHFEIRYRGTPVDPLDHLPKR